MVTISPGKMYGIYSTLEKLGLIRLTRAVNRLKSFSLAEKETTMLREHIWRLNIMTLNGIELLEKL